MSSRTMAAPGPLELGGVQQLEPVDQQVLVLAQATVGRHFSQRSAPRPASSVVPSNPMTTVRLAHAEAYLGIYLDISH